MAKIRRREFARRATTAALAGPLALAELGKQTNEAPKPEPRLKLSADQEVAVKKAVERDEQQLKKMRDLVLPAPRSLPTLLTPYFGGGGTRHVTVDVFPEASVAVIIASPGPTSKCLIASGPIVLTKVTPDLPGLCVILIVSPLASAMPPIVIFGAPHASLPETW